MISNNLKPMQDQTIRNLTSQGIVSLEPFLCQFQSVEVSEDNFTYNYHGLCPQLSSDELNFLKVLCSVLVVEVDIIFYIALALGLPGNILMLLAVFSMKTTSTRLYTSCLAISDFCSLAVAGQVFKKMVSLAEHLNFAERRLRYLGMSFQALSNWVLSFYCIERYVSARYATPRHRFFTADKVFISLFLGLVISFVPFVYHEISMYLSYRRCSGDEVMFTIVQNVSYSVLPGSLMLVAAAMTACHVKIKLYAFPTRNSVSQATFQNQNTTDAQLTLASFLMVICFVVLALPLTVIYSFQSFSCTYFDRDACSIKETVYLFVYKTFNALSYLNNATHFYMYFLCVKEFRRCVVQLITLQKFRQLLLQVSRRGQS